MKYLQYNRSNTAALTLIEILFLVGVIVVLILASLPAVYNGPVKNGIPLTLSNYRQLYILTQTATLDSKSSNGTGKFPGDLSNSAVNWRNYLVSNKYISEKNFQNLIKVEGRENMTTVWNDNATDTNSHEVFLSTVGISGTGTNLTFSPTGPYGKHGGSLATLDGAAQSLSGTNPPHFPVSFTTNGFNRL